MSRALPERILNKFDVVESTGCWAWNASMYPNGYGQVWNGHRTEQAHRVVYRLLCSEIASGLEVDHICRNRACVNPAHLRLVSHRENMRCSDAVMGLNARKTHCKRGHLLAGDNLKLQANGSRNCKTCLRLLARNSRIRRLANGNA